MDRLLMTRSISPGTSQSQNDKARPKPGFLHSGTHQAGHHPHRLHQARPTTSHPHSGHVSGNAVADRASPAGTARFEEPPRCETFQARVNTRRPFGDYGIRP